MGNLASGIFGAVEKCQLKQKKITLEDAYKLERMVILDLLFHLYLFVVYSDKPCKIIVFDSLAYCCC